MTLYQLKFILEFIIFIGLIIEKIELKMRLVKFFILLIFMAPMSRGLPIDEDHDVRYDMLDELVPKEDFDNRENLWAEFLFDGFLTRFKANL